MIRFVGLFKIFLVFVFLPGLVWIICEIWKKYHPRVLWGPRMKEMKRKQEVYMKEILQKKAKFIEKTEYQPNVLYISKRDFDSFYENSGWYYPHSVKSSEVIKHIDYGTGLEFAGMMIHVGSEDFEISVAYRPAGLKRAEQLLADLKDNWIQVRE